MSFRSFLKKSIFVLALLASFGWCLEAYAASLRLNWTDASTNETGFKIERMAGNGRSYAQIATVAPNVKTYTDTTATPGTTYCYRVRAFNSVGTSSPSNAGCETAPKASSSSSSNSSNGSSTVPSPNPTPTVNLNPTLHVSSKWSDYRITMKMRSTDDNRLGVMFRYQDDDDYYLFSWSVGSRRLEKRVNGALKMLAQDTARYTRGQTYALQIIAQGSAIKVLIDGKTIFTVKDTSLSEGTIALYSQWNAGSYFDDVRVEDLATGKVLLSDNFNDPDHVGWTIVDEGDKGGPSEWSADNGAFVQSSNINGTYALYTRGSWQDYRVALKMISADDDTMGVMFRYQDARNYYRFSWANGTRKLEKRTGGAFKVLAQDTARYTKGRTYALQIIAQGSTLKVLVDGKTTFSAKDSSFSEGTIALYSSWNAGSSFDDVLVEDLTTGSVLLSDNFNNHDYVGWTVLDEGSQAGPSQWSAATGAFVQSSNIDGTYALYRPTH